MNNKSFIAHVLLFAVFLTGCDAVIPDDEGNLVVEAFIDAAEPLPPVRVSRTQDLGIPLSETSNEQSGTSVRLVLNDVAYQYLHSETEVGLYLPLPQDQTVLVAPGSHFQLQVDTEFESAIATGRVPPKLELRDISVSISDEPISAVLIDTLDIGLDSLNLGLNASTGFIYPVQVTVTWSPSEFEGWVETRLDPLTDFSSSLIDFFLLPSQIFREENAEQSDEGLKIWNGVYAIPVQSEDDPVPAHSLKITLLRGDERYARYATSRNDPTRREPVSSLNGALGFVGGVSIDSLRIPIGN